jgi:hypothetical protein
MPPLMRFSTTTPPSIYPHLSTPATAQRPSHRRLVATPAVSFHPCGFPPLRRFTPVVSSGGIALQNQKGFVTFPARRSLASRARRNVFALWLETFLAFPATQVPLKGYPLPTAVPRHRGRCLLGVTSPGGRHAAQGCIWSITLGSLLVEQADLLKTPLGRTVSSFAVSRANECRIPRALPFKALLRR